MAHISRRDFLAGAAAAGALVVSNRSGVLAENAPSAVAPIRVKSGTDLVTLGKTGVRTSVLGIGTGTRGGSEQRALGTGGFTKLVRHAVDSGVRYIDTAQNYRMHTFVQIAVSELKGGKKDDLFIQTKSPAKHPEVIKADIERYRKELGIDKIDSLLMHCMMDGGWPTDMRPVMDTLNDEREKGRVRSVGVSCHGFDPLVAAADCHWVQTHLVRINPYGLKMDDEKEKVVEQLRKMYAQGRGILGMKIFGETGLESAEQRLASLKYVLGLGCVHAFTIGFTSPAQIDETLELIEKATA